MATEHAPADIRNIALVGHGGSGKTTLTERLLFSAGAIQRMGSVEENNTVSDWSEEEHHHQHSLRQVMVHFEAKSHMSDKSVLVNLLDTPGLGDFIGHAIASLPAVETAMVVIDAGKGIETVTRRIYNVAQERNLPRAIVINKIDEHDLDLEGLVERIRDVFGNQCLPINLPTAGGESVINVFEAEHADGAEPVFSSVEEAHQQIQEQVVEVDDSLTEAYFEGGELDPVKLHKAFEVCLREGHLVPICFVSAKTGAGIDDLMHVIVDYLPSPLEGNPRPFVNEDEDGNESPYEYSVDPDKPLLAHVFKIAADPFVGKLGVFRVHQGRLKVKDEVYIGANKKPVRIAHLYKRQGKDNVEVESLGAGDIGAVAKIDELHFGSVLHTDHDADKVHLKKLPLPKPMFGLAIELKNRKDESKFAPATHKMMEEDPCLIFERVEATKQTVMRGLGELHLRVVEEKLKDQYGIEIETETPKIAFRESIAANAEGHHRHKKQSGGSGEFGEVYLRVSPLPVDHENHDEPTFEFVNATVGGSIPKQFLPAIEKGIRGVLQEGAIAGYPMTGVRVEVYDGKFHAVDSKEIAFIKAGRKAFIDAVQKAKPILLEPYVHLEVTAPNSYMGDIASDLSTKRGRVQDTEMIGSDTVVVKAQAPLGELQNYSNQLKSMTGGAGSYTIDFSHEERTPPNIQAEVVAAFKGHQDDD
ncbi:MAG TPA: elongation factor G [Phycisphaerales bacterium]|nr:elongation factor G [Phycisphaerales bacterium]